MGDEYIDLMEAEYWRIREQEQQERIDRLLYLNNYRDKEVPEHIANLLIILD